MSEHSIVNLAGSLPMVKKISEKNKNILRMLDPEELKIGGLSDDNAEDHLEDEIDSELDDDSDNFALDSVTLHDFITRYEYLKEEI